jgi:hypothetical protein
LVESFSYLSALAETGKFGPFPGTRLVQTARLKIDGEFIYRQAKPRLKSRNLLAEITVYPKAKTGGLRAFFTG